MTFLAGELTACDGELLRIETVKRTLTFVVLPSNMSKGASSEIPSNPALSVSLFCRCGRDAISY